MRGPHFDARGIEMRSDWEVQCAAELDRLGVKYEYEIIELEYFKGIRNGVCGECGSGEVLTRRHYYPDFWLPELNIHLEPKGKFGQVVRVKMRQVKKYHPDEDIRMIFMRNNFIGKRSKTRTTYEQYATRIGIPSSTGVASIGTLLGIQS